MAWGMDTLNEPLLPAFFSPVVQSVASCVPHDERHLLYLLGGEKAQHTRRDWS